MHIWKIILQFQHSVFMFMRWKILLLLSGTLLLLGVFAINLFFYATEDDRLRGIPIAANHSYSFTEPFEELFLPSPDGGIVHAVWFSKPAAKTALIFFPGTHSDAVQGYQLMKDKVTEQQELVVVEYRGCGKTVGASSESAFYSDAELVYQAVAARFAPDQIQVCGFSLGGPIAASLASSKPVGGLLLIAPLYSINEKYRFRPWHYRKYSFPTYRFLSKINCPVFFFAGTKDGLYDDTRRLAKQYPGFFGFEGAGHIDLFQLPAFRRAFITSTQSLPHGPGYNPPK